MTFENLIQRFKVDLVKQINEDQGFTQDREMNKTAQIVDKLFPVDHFFSFMLYDSSKDKQMALKEKEDLYRILDMTIDSGNFVIENYKKCHMLPVVMNNDCREQIIHQV